jgi:hypothetical protein
MTTIGTPTPVSKVKNANANNAQCVYENHPFLGQMLKACALQFLADTCPALHDCLIHGCLEHSMRHLSGMPLPARNFLVAYQEGHGRDC